MDSTVTRSKNHIQSTHRFAKVNMITSNHFPLTVNKSESETVSIQLFLKAFRYTRCGWSETCLSENLLPYWQKQHEITIQNDCLLCGIQVVIPEQYLNAVLYSLYEGHPGFVRIKALACQHFWLPKLDNRIESTACNCYSC